MTVLINSALSNTVTLPPGLFVIFAKFTTSSFASKVSTPVAPVRLRVTEIFISSAPPPLVVSIPSVLSVTLVPPVRRPVISFTEIVNPLSPVAVQFSKQASSTPKSVPTTVIVLGSSRSSPPLPVGEERSICPARFGRSRYFLPEISAKPPSPEIAPPRALI